jgi:fucose 4-O-acetylase-like acetyltransferase
MDAPGGATAPPRARVPFWDTARFVAISLVVIGHAIQRLTADSDAALVAYLFIFAFHMPLFALISGHFSRSGAPDERRMRRVVTDIVLPYIVFESIWTAVQFLVEGRTSLNPTTPSWTLWFLLALAIFRVLLPYLALVRWPLLWSIVASVSVGYFTNVDSTFSLSRAIGILPFFVLGWKLHEWGVLDRWRGFARPGALLRTGAAAVLLAWLALITVNISTWRAADLRFWFFYDDAYGVLGADEWWAGGVRLALIALAVLLSFCVLVLIPRRDTPVTALGQGTMYVYLLHSFVLYPLRETGVLEPTPSTEWIWLLGLTVISVCIAAFLASAPVRRAFRPLVEPRPRWLFRSEGDARTGPLDLRPSRTDPTGSRRSGR